MRAAVRIVAGLSLLGLAVVPHQAATATASAATAAAQPLAGIVIGIDPGHNGDNWQHTGQIDRKVWNGREYEDCDTTGTQTDRGYPEARFTWQVSRYLTADLQAYGAKVVATRSSNTGWGPCVDSRAHLLDNAKAAVAIDIHADGGPPSGRGFAILLPVADGPNDRVIAASKRFGVLLRSAVTSGVGEPVSSYDGRDGFAYRNDLAGLNLTTVPKVLIECANMRNSRDAALLTSTAWQQKVARAMAAAIVRFVTTR